jgi:hypothetical protein
MNFGLFDNKLSLCECPFPQLLYLNIVHNLDGEKEASRVREEHSRSMKLTKICQGIISTSCLVES